MYKSAFGNLVTFAEVRILISEKVICYKTLMGNHRPDNFIPKLFILLVDLRNVVWVTS